MNSSLPITAELPPLPAYKLSPIPDLIEGVPDILSAAVIPIVVYWILSLFFHYIDVYDIWPQYRIHTPEEITKRNHVSRYEVARDVIIQQIIQIGMSLFLDATEERQVIGKEEYDVAVWATRVRLAQRAFPSILSLLGLNASAISKNMAASHPLLAGALAGGHYPFLTTASLDGSDPVPTFAFWEMAVAKAIYWAAIPALQIFVASVLLDTWQYFLHRLMHTNRWMYSKFDFPSLADEPNGPGSLDLNIVLMLTVLSYLPLSTPPPLCALCLWRLVQPPL